MEVVSADGNADAGRDVEWTHRAIERVRVHDSRDVGVHEFGLKDTDDLACVEPILVVCQIVDAPLRRELPDARNPRGPRTEPRLQEVAPHVSSAKEPYLW